MIFDWSDYDIDAQLELAFGDKEPPSSTDELRCCVRWASVVVSRRGGLVCCWCGREGRSHEWKRA